MTPSETLKQAELETWLDHPFTKNFVLLLEDRVKRLMDGMVSGSYVYGEPAKTAENCAQYAARINELYNLIGALTKKEEMQEEIDALNDVEPEEEASE